MKYSPFIEFLLVFDCVRRSESPEMEHRTKFGIHKDIDNHRDIQVIITIL